MPTDGAVERDISKAVVGMKPAEADYFEQVVKKALELVE
jgi:hypothetical protein